MHAGRETRMLQFSDNCRVTRGVPRQAERGIARRPEIPRTKGPKPHLRHKDKSLYGVYFHGKFTWNQALDEEQCRGFGLRAENPRIGKDTMNNTLRILALFAALSVVACSLDHVTGPENPGEPMPHCTTPGVTRVFRDSGIVGAAGGGTLEFHSGSLEIPPGSLEQDTEIAVQVSVTQCDITRNEYEFSPSGTRFNPPATLRLSYGMMGSIDVQSLLLLLYDEGLEKWVVAANMVQESGHHRYSGPIEHFSRYSLSANGQTTK